MEKDKLWEYYVSKNPHFLTGPINFKPESLKKFFDQVWLQCEKECKPKQSDTNTKPFNVDGNSFSDLLNGMWGKK